MFADTTAAPAAATIERINLASVRISRVPISRQHDPQPFDAWHNNA